MMFLVKLTHCRTCGWDDIIDEKEQCILRSQVNSFANEEVKLSNCWETSKYSKFMTDKVQIMKCVSGIRSSLQRRLGVQSPWNKR